MRCLIGAAGVGRTGIGGKSLIHSDLPCDGVEFDLPNCPWVAGARRKGAVDDERWLFERRHVPDKSVATASPS